MADEKIIGAYVCTGCGIGERLDAGTLTNVAQRDGKAKENKNNYYGRQLADEDVLDYRVQCVCVYTDDMVARLERSGIRLSTAYGRASHNKNSSLGPS